MSNARLYRFVLNGFNIRKYWEEDFPGDIRLLNDDDVDVDESYQSTEPVSELSYDVETLKHIESNKYIRYMGNCSDKHKLWVIDIDLLRHISMPVTTERRCNRCHHTFSTMPIGCPIHYINLGENTNRSRDILDKLQIRNLNLDDNSEIFITKKVFCTLNCLAAWIDKKSKTDSLYEKCHSMFTLLVKKLEYASSKKLDVHPSPEIETLICYGGHLTIEEYRNLNGQLVYEVSKNIQAPLFFPAGEIVEEMLGVKMIENT